MGLVFFVFFLSLVFHVGFYFSNCLMTFFLNIGFLLQFVMVSFYAGSGAFFVPFAGDF